MWIFLVVAVLGIFIVIGSILMGGIFTIIAVPICAFAVIAAAATGALGRFLQRGERVSRAGPERASRRPATPDDLVNARRVQQ
jgi:drug/metabolite transporter (DMT)-like permease